MNEATTPQKDFILSLLADREVPEDLRATLDSEWATLTKVGASVAITTLKGLPYSRKNVKFVDPVLAGLPHSFYAIPTYQADSAVADLNLNGDLLFVEVAQYMGTVYMRALHGAPGRFNRERVSRRDVTAIANLLNLDPMKYIRLFGQHFTVCGKCGAELTDQKSRESGFGPQCRKQLGL